MEIFLWIDHLSFFFFFFWRWHLNSLFIYLFTYLFIYLFIFGYVGPLFLCEGFLQLQQAGATLHHRVWAFHCCSLSRCGAQAPDAHAQQLWLTGLVAPRHVGSPQTRARTRVPCIGRQILNHCTTREAPRSPFFISKIFLIEVDIFQFVINYQQWYFSISDIPIYHWIESKFLTTVHVHMHINIFILWTNKYVETQ